MNPFSRIGKRFLRSSTHSFLEEPRRHVLVPIAGTEAGSFAQLSSSDTPSEEVAETNTTGGTINLRFKIGNPIHFYFGRDDGGICRLCNEFVPGRQISYHIHSNRGTSTHAGREIVLDSLVFQALRGKNPIDVKRSWPYTIVKHSAFPRIMSLLPSKLEDLSRRSQQLHNLLTLLTKLGVLQMSIKPHSEPSNDPLVQRLGVKRRLAFERLELIGDNSWGSQLSWRMLLIFPDKQWDKGILPHSYNLFRELAETNWSFVHMYDVLQLHLLIPTSLRSQVGEGKIKADVFEAIIGELFTFLYSHAPLIYASEDYTEPNCGSLTTQVGLVQHVLAEIFDLTLLWMLDSLTEYSMPIVGEVAANALIMPIRPIFFKGDTARQRKQASSQAAPQKQLRPFLSRESQPPPSENTLDPAILGPLAAGSGPRLCGRPSLPMRHETIQQLPYRCDVLLQSRPSTGPPVAPMKRIPVVPALSEAVDVTALLLKKRYSTSSCPFELSPLSLSPTTSPYGLTSEKWKALWLICGERLFNDDVDPVVVLAQHEASSSLTQATESVSDIKEMIVEGDADDAARAMDLDERHQFMERVSPGFAVGGSSGLNLLSLTGVTRELNFDRIKRRNVDRNSN